MHVCDRFTGHANREGTGLNLLACNIHYRRTVNVLHNLKHEGKYEKLVVTIDNQVC